MLEIYVPESEHFNEETNEFFNVNGQTLKLEHSLVSISKWEAKWHKSFLNSDDKTNEEIIDYIRCMSINPIDKNVLLSLTEQNLLDIQSYIQDPMTATVIKDTPGHKNNEIITSELIYYWMVALEIPIECEKWHLNRLLTLIKVCNVKNQPSKKMSKRDIYNQNRMLNEARKAKYHTRG